MTMESAKRTFVDALRFSLAGLFVVESWLWDKSRLGLQILAKREDVSNVETKLRNFIAPLSQKRTLVVFLLPLALAPLLLRAAFALMGEGQILYGLTVFLVGQTVVLGVMACLFDMCRDKLLGMTSFASFADALSRMRGQAEIIVAPTWARGQETIGRIRTRIETEFEREKAYFGERWATLRTLVASKAGNS